MSPVQPTALVDLDAVAHNIAILRERAGSAQVMPIVKADGYGHGATSVARAALAAGAAELGVATIDEALALRRDGITAAILAWLHPPSTDFAPALQADVQIGVSSTRQLDEVLAAVRATGTPATITVKVDTGLNRNGVALADFPDLLDAVGRGVAEGALRARGLMSHDQRSAGQTVHRPDRPDPRARHPVRGGASGQLARHVDPS